MRRDRRWPLPLPSTVNPTLGLPEASAALHPPLSSSGARTARRERRSACAPGLPQRGPAPVRRARRWRLPLPSTVKPTPDPRGAPAVPHPSLSSPGARTARRDRRKDCAGPPRRAGTVAGGCRFPPRQAYAGSLWGYCRSARALGLPQRGPAPVRRDQVGSNQPYLTRRCCGFWGHRTASFYNWQTVTQCRLVFSCRPLAKFTLQSLRHWRMPLSPPSTLHRVSVGLLPLCIPRCPPRGLGLHAGIAARTAPSAYRSAGPRRCAHCAETVAGGCRFPHCKLYAGSLWGSCRISSLAVLPVGSDCTPGSQRGSLLRTAAARAHAGAP